jgi:hypothetical protein
VRRTNYSMEVLPQRRSRWVRKRTKSPTAWKSYIKGGAGGEEEDELRHGSSTSKEEQVREEDEETRKLKRTKNPTAWKSYLKGGAGGKRTKNPPGGRRSHLILEWRSSG